MNYSWPEESAEDRYDRVYAILEVCDSLGIVISVHPTEDFLMLESEGSLDYPELKQSMIHWKSDIVKVLRYIEELE